MRPIDFREANRTYTKPSSMTDEECSPLRVCDTGEALISCWCPTWRERLTILVRGRVWLWVVGRGQPPVAVEAASPWIATPPGDTGTPRDTGADTKGGTP
jgi:hypothetical protein